MHREICVYVCGALTALSVHSSRLPESAPNSVHPEHRKLDEHDRPARKREVRQLARPQPPLRQHQREYVIHHARPEHRVRHERGEPERGARERLHERVRRRAHAERDADGVEGVQHGERGAGLGAELRREVVVRVDDGQACEGGELSEGTDEDEGESDEEVLMHKEEGIDACEGSDAEGAREGVDVPRQTVPAAYSGAYGNASSAPISVAS
jgi:hypothetical protein